MKRLSHLLSAVLMIAVAASAQVTPVVHYKFDEGAGAATADASGNGYDAVLGGGASWTAGKLGDGLDFAGNNGYIDVPEAVLNNHISTQITVTMWLHGSPEQPHTGYVYHSEAAGRRIHAFRCPVKLGASWYVMWNAFGAVGDPEDEIYRQLDLPADDDLIEGRWNHWALTKDTTTGSMKIYLNGTVLAGGNGKTSLPPAATCVTIGNSCTHDLGYDGKIDDFRIYDRQLSQTEIEAVMNTLPDQAFAPDPCDLAAGQDIDLTLLWSAGQSAVSHNVYFGTNPEALAQVALEHPETRYQLPVLDLATTYHWRVDEVDAAGGIVTGEVWSFTTVASLAASDYYVSIDGDDNQPGTLELPFRTIEKARDTLRVSALPAGGATVWLREGVYYLDEPLVLGPEDSGSELKPIVYRAYPGETPVISGGREISGWTHLGNDRWRTTIAEVPAGNWWFRQLWCDGQRCPRSRWPNADVDVNDLPAIISTSNSDKTLVMDQAIMQDDFAAQGSEVAVRLFWALSRARIQSKDNSTTVTCLTTPGLPNSEALGPKPGTWHKPAFFENHPDYIDQAWEWHLHPTTGELTCQAEPGADLNDHVLVAPVLEKLVVIEGRAADPLHDITFRNISFRHTGWHLPDEGYAPSLNGYYRKPELNHDFHLLMPALMLSYAENVTFADCSFENFGANGVAYGPGCHRTSITGSDISDTGGIGVVVGWKGDSDTGYVDPAIHSYWADPPVDRPRAVTLSNNYIHDCAVEWMGHAAVFTSFADDTLIEHNIIAHVPFLGISSGFGQSQNGPLPGPPNQHGTQLLANHIHHVMRSFNDGGAIYTNGDHDGALFSGNWIHDVGPGWQAGREWLCIGAYFDGSEPIWTRNIDVVGNITYDVLGLDRGPGSAYQAYITLGVNYWDEDPYDAGGPHYHQIHPIAEAAGTMPSPPALTIEIDTSGENVSVRGACAAWAQIASARVAESGDDITSYLSVKPNGAIHGLIPRTAVRSTLTTLNVSIADPDGHIGPAGVSNTIDLHHSDLNQDGRVDWQDLALFSMHWLQCDAPECD